MLIDCDTCAVRDLQCDDCVVTVLLGSVPLDTDHTTHAALAARAGHVHVDDDERRALAVLAESGLVPRLRLVPLGLPDPAAPGPPGRRAAVS